MSEPLLGHQVLVAQYDLSAGLATLRAELAGPAGTAGLEVGPGLELDIDVADPASLVELNIELSLNGRMGKLPLAMRRRLTTLLGPERAEALANRQQATRLVHSGGPPSGTRAGHHVPAGDGHSPAMPAGVVPALHRAAMAQATAAQVGASLPVQSLGLLEAATALDQVGHLLGVSDVAHRNAEIGADLLGRSVEGDLLTVPDRATARAVASVLRSAIHLLTGARSTATDLSTLADALDRGAHVTCPRRWAAMAGPPRDTSPSSPHASGGPVTVDQRSLPGALTDAKVSAHRVGPSEVEVRIAGWAERRHGLWARGFDASDDVPHALGPFRRDGRDAVALLFLAPDVMPRIEVDVTDRPELSRPSSVLALLQRAIHLGFVAARCERVGDRRQAAHRWGQCAHAWDTAGDPVRAEQARRYADQTSTGAGGVAHRLIAPLVSDLISHALASRTGA